MLTSAIDLTFTAVEESMIRSRSRKRLDLTRPVEPELILECIEIAMQSPTGTNQQNWSFVVVTDADKRAAIATGTVGPAR